jgi:hypothetical protein
MQLLARLLRRLKSLVLVATAALNVSISRPVPERASSLSQTVPFNVATSFSKVPTRVDAIPM